MDVEQKLREALSRAEGLAARAVLNYVIYEFEVGGPTREVLEEALKIAEREAAELARVIALLKGLEVYV